MAEDSDRARVLVGDTDLFFFFLRGGRCESQAAAVIGESGKGALVLRTSSEVYDDAISAIRADGAPIDVARDFVADMKSIPHTPYPMSGEIAEEAMSLYLSHGGRRGLSYFDSFHIATARRHDLAILTSDKYMIEHSAKLGVSVVDLSKWKVPTPDE